VSSILVSEPVESRGKPDETEESDGQLLVTSGDMTVAFNSGEVVFDRVSLRIEAAVETIGNAPGAFGRGANLCSAGRFESAVSCAIVSEPIERP
jgi:hypothetical protein